MRLTKELGYASGQIVFGLALEIRPDLSGSIFHILTALLRKPASPRTARQYSSTSSSHGDSTPLFFDIVRQARKWIPIAGTAITLFSAITPLIVLARWIRHITRYWIEYNIQFWQYLIPIKIHVTRPFAIVLTANVALVLMFASSADLVIEFFSRTFKLIRVIYSGLIYTSSRIVISGLYFSARSNTVASKAKQLAEEQYKRSEEDIKRKFQNKLKTLSRKREGLKMDQGTLDREELALKTWEQSDEAKRLREAKYTLFLDRLKLKEKLQEKRTKLNESMNELNAEEKTIQKEERDLPQKMTLEYIPVARAILIESATSWSRSRYRRATEEFNEPYFPSNFVEYSEAKANLALFVFFVISVISLFVIPTIELNNNIGMDVWELFYVYCGSLFYMVLFVSVIASPFRLVFAQRAFSVSVLLLFIFIMNLISLHTESLFRLLAEAYKS